jgi:hypothetical protein
MYASGVPLAILLVSTGIWIVEALPARLSTTVARAVPYAIVFAVVPVIALAYDGTEGLRRGSAENERFAAQLQAQVSPMPPGSTLYVAPIPSSLEFLGHHSHLDAMVEMYLGKGVRTVVFDPTRPPQLGPDDRIFRYQP